MRRGNLEIVKLLLANEKIDVSKLDKYGYTALAIAQKRGFQTIASLLKEKGALSVRVDQTAVLSKIKEYLSYNKRDENFIEQFNKGYCSGISALEGYAKLIEDMPNPENKPRDDFTWFKKTLNLIINWQQPEKEIVQKLNELKEKHNELAKEGLAKKPPVSVKPYEEIIKEVDELKKNDPTTAQELKKLISDNEEIERFISNIQYFQHIRDYLPAVAQSDLDKSLEDTKRTLKREYDIASLFTLEQLKQLLKTKDLIQENKMILITSDKHATNLIKKGNHYYYFDPNSKIGELQTISIDKVAEKIFDANFDSQYTKPSPIGLRIFTLGEKSQNYPAQKDVLSAINNTSPLEILQPEEGYAKNVSGLCMAIDIGSLESVKYFLKLTNPNLTDKTTGFTALSLAIVKKRTEIVKELLTNNELDVNKPDKYEDTPLISAIIGGNLEIVRLLLANNEKTDVNKPDKYENTPLIVAIEEGNPEIVKLLLDAGAKPNIKAFATAIKSKHFDAAKPLQPYAQATRNRMLTIGGIVMAVVLTLLITATLTTALLPALPIPIIGLLTTQTVIKVAVAIASVVMLYMALPTIITISIGLKKLKQYDLREAKEKEKNEELSDKTELSSLKTSSLTETKTGDERPEKSQLPIISSLSSTQFSKPSSTAIDNQHKLLTRFGLFKIPEQDQQEPPVVNVEKEPPTKQK